jgi:hypothetical protein
MRTLYHSVRGPGKETGRTGSIIRRGEPGGGEVGTRELTRREWMRGGAVAAAQEPRRGAQRLSVERLQDREALGYGMFLHFGMSTFDGRELSDGRSPAALYAPDALDVDQWASVARDAGMKYAVLTAKHVALHCLWPSRHTGYTVANSTDRTDVCERFVDACRRRGVRPGFYYCSWDNHHRFGSRTPSAPSLARDRGPGVLPPG